MRRALGTAAAAIVLVASIGAGASADDAGGGTQRWTAGFDAGAPAFSNDIAVTPDGTTAFVTGGTTMGPTGHMATLAYGTADGAEKWSSQFPGATHPDDFGRGTSVAVSPDGQTLFVGGWTVCEQNCDASSFEGWVIAAFDVATGDRLWLSRVASMGGGPESIVPNPDGSQVYVFGITDGGQAQAVIAFDPATGDRVWEYDRANATGWYGFGFEGQPRRIHGVRGRHLGHLQCLLLSIRPAYDGDRDGRRHADLDEDLCDGDDGLQLWLGHRPRRQPGRLDGVRHRGRR